MQLPDPPLAARRAGLRYVTASAPGITRRKQGRGFVYISATGPLVREKTELARIRALAIPPAWTSVWICPLADGYLQATGMDERGRKQYRYHDAWTALRNLVKFETLAGFGALLPAIRTRVDRDLRLPGMPREKVAACILHLMDRTFIRVGNSEYARDNDSYGLTTMLNKHARVAGSKIRFCFKSKSGRLCDTVIESSEAARIVRVCQELPGQELFCYIDAEGVTRDIGSSDVNEYLSEITGEPLTAKDFRTWGGTCAAAAEFHRAGPPVGKDGGPLSPTELKRREVAAIKAASNALCNTVAVCRKFYVHPELKDLYAAGRLLAMFERAAGLRMRRMSVAERAVLLLLRPSGAKKAGARAA